MGYLPLEYDSLIAWTDLRIWCSSAVLHRQAVAQIVCLPQADTDRVKWIEGDDCSTRGISGGIGDRSGLRDFDLVYFESTGFTAQTIAFSETEIGGPYALCCEWNNATMGSFSPSMNAIEELFCYSSFGTLRVNSRFNRWCKVA